MADIAALNTAILEKREAIKELQWQIVELEDQIAHLEDPDALNEACGISFGR